VFWKAWSPAGSRLAHRPAGPVVRVDDVLAGDPAPIRVLASRNDACVVHPELRGPAICSPPVRSPDGRLFAGVEVASSDLPVAAADGIGDPGPIPDTGDIRPGAMIALGPPP
jgi:hypothetical protein